MGSEKERRQRGGAGRSRLVLTSNCDRDERTSIRADWPECGPVSVVNNCESGYSELHALALSSFTHHAFLHVFCAPPPLADRSRSGYCL